ncbi:MAG: 1-(5-phosphoribosyl)-5-[(5-phosphoribosylamino)methylideneamino]imidazole-4-carboxamide isomerase [Clostridiales bacterium]|nr:1-(5-phosphoribosyl)-5-[(5-phosphoribosylamino)methylideneamino]imidazole-4-carboxamide isomerase [Clostridiales bacterium]
MIIFPAIDLFDKKAVRLYKGDYKNMTVYSDNPVEIALDFKSCGATHMHVVDLEGAKTGQTPNIEVIKSLVSATDMFVEVGGGIRSMEVVDRYISAGVSRVILGTSAVTDQEFLILAIKKYGDKIAVGVDIKDGMVAIKGWTEKSEIDGFSFCEKMQDLGVKTIICTDISKDGAMQGANHALYKRLKEELKIDVIASGGVSSMEDVKRLREINFYGAIIGKAYYTKAIDLKDAIKVAR